MIGLAAGMVLAALAGHPAVAGEAGGHLLDVGVVPYVQDSDRGGVKVEGRLNLAKSDPEAALYLTVGGGMGSWYFTRKPKGIGKALDVVLVVPWVYKTLTGGYKRKEDNFTEWKTRQTFADIGMAAGFGKWLLGGGITVVSFDTDVFKKINGDPYTGAGTGTTWGGYGQLGWQVPIGPWFLDISGGYRQTRGTAKITVTNAAGATNVAPVRPIWGPYGSIGLRYRF